MPDEAREATLAARVRVLQIVVFAMVMGVAMLSVVAFTVSRGMEPPGAGRRPIVTYVGLGLGVVALAAGPKIGRTAASAGARKAGQAEGPARVEALLNRFMAKTIVTCAICEGGALFLVVAYLVDRQLVSLLGALVLALVLLAQLPTRGRVETWLEEQLPARGHDPFAMR